MFSRRVLLAGAATTLLIPRGLRSQTAGGSNPDLYTASSEAHAIAAVNISQGIPSCNDWYNIQTTLANIYNDFVYNGLNEQIASAAQQIPASWVTPGVFDQTAILSYIQGFEPNYSMDLVQGNLSYLQGQSPDAIAEVVGRIAAGGILPYLSNMITVTGKIGLMLQNGGTPSISGGPTANRLPRTPPPEPGGGGYSCAADGALAVAAGLAFATLTVMTLGSVDVLAGAAWFGIATWGGIGTTAWGAGHAMKCGF